MNGYNSYPISAEAWQAVIQPRAKVIMSMIVDELLEEGRCVNILCSGRITPTSDKDQLVW
jgi:hypothetical protein